MKPDRLKALIVIVLVVISALSLATSQSNQPIGLPAGQPSQLKSGAPLLHTRGRSRLLLQAPQSPQSSLYLISNSTVKVLRVPYYPQDNVGECWLYSLKMVLKYFGVNFNESEVLRAMGFGYDRGLQINGLKFWIPMKISDEVDKLKDVVQKLYGVKLEEHIIRDDPGKLMRLVEEEVNNGRPLWMTIYDIGHTVAVVGYMVKNNSKYIVVNDPSGYLVYNYINWTLGVLLFKAIFSPNKNLEEVQQELQPLWLFSDYNTKIRPGLAGLIDLINKIKSGEIRSYRGVALNIQYFNKKLDVLAVDPSSAPPPNPPLASVSGYTISNSPELDHVHGLLRPSIEFSHYRANNPARPSLWIPIPAAEVGDAVTVPVTVCSNEALQGPGQTVRYIVRLAIHVYNALLHQDYTINKVREVSLSAGACREVSFTFNPAELVGLGGYGKASLKLEVYEASTMRLLDSWGPIGLYIYQWVYDYRIPLGCGVLTATVGLASLSNGKTLLDVFFNVTKLQVTTKSITIVEPARKVIDLPYFMPSPDKGGYYPKASFVVPSSVPSVTVRGTIEGSQSSWIPPWRQTRRCNFSFTVPIVTPALQRRLWVQGITYYKDKAVVTYIYRHVVPSLESLNATIRGGGVEWGRASLSFKEPPSASMLKVNVTLRGVPTAPLLILNTSASFQGPFKGRVVETCLHVNPFVLRLSEEPSTITVAPGGYAEATVSVEIQKQPPNLRWEFYRFGLRFKALIDGVKAEAVSESLGDNKFRVIVKVPLLTEPGAHNLTIIPVIYSKRTGCTVWSPLVNVTVKLRVISPGITGKAPVAVVIVLDKSGSMGDKFKGHTKMYWAKEAASTLVDLAMDGDLMGLVVFDYAPHKLLDLKPVNDEYRRIFKDTLANVQPGGATDIGDSLLLAASMLSSVKQNVTGRAIILLTDGIHNTGTPPLVALQKIKGTGIKIFTIGLGEPGQYNETVLRRLAEETGGKYYYAPTPDVLREIFDSIRKTITGIPLIDTILRVLTPGGTGYVTYKLPSIGLAVLDVSWNTTTPLTILLNISGMVVSQANASKVGINVTRPRLNTIRFIIPLSGPSTGAYAGLPRHMISTIPLAVIIRNNESRGATARVDLYSTYSEPLLVQVVGSPSYAEAGGALLVRAYSARGLVIAAYVMNDTQAVTEAILYDDGLHSDGLPGDNVYGGLVRIPSKPGHYTLVVKAYKSPSTPVRSVVMPLIVKRPSKRIFRLITDNRTHNIFLEGAVPLKLEVFKPANISLTAMVKGPAGVVPPTITIEPATVIASRPGTYNVTIHVAYTPLTAPGTYNVTVIALHSGIVEKANVTLRLARVFVKPLITRLTITAIRGVQANYTIPLSVETDVPVNVSVGLTWGPPARLGISGAWNYTVGPGRHKLLLPLTLKPTVNLGVYLGFMETWVNQRSWSRIPAYLIVVPAIANTSTLRWLAAPGRVILSMKGLSLEVWNSTLATAYMALARGSGSSTYIVYAGGKANLTVDLGELGLVKGAKITVVNLESGAKRVLNAKQATSIFNITLGRGAYMISVQAAPPVTTSVTKTTTTTTMTTKTTSSTTSVSATCTPPPPPSTVVKRVVSTKYITVRPKGLSGGCLIGIATLTASLVIVLVALAVVVRRTRV